MSDRVKDKLVHKEVSEWVHEWYSDWVTGFCVSEWVNILFSLSEEIIVYFKQNILNEITFILENGTRVNLNNREGQSNSTPVDKYLTWTKKGEQFYRAILEGPNM